MKLRIYDTASYIRKTVQLTSVLIVYMSLRACQPGIRVVHVSFVVTDYGKAVVVQ